MDVRMDTLPSGIRVVSVEMPHLATAAVGAFVGVGSRDEPPEHNGIAHFFEHMAFKGTPARTAYQISSQIEDLGAAVNAYTSHDITAYYASGLDDVLAPAVQIIGDVLAHSSFDPKDTDNERGVINQEIRRYADDPDDVVINALNALSYPDHAYGRTILGTPGSLERIDSAALGGFVTNRYGGPNVVVAAAGRVDHNALLDMVAREFADLDRPVLSREPEMPTRRGGIALLDQANFEQVAFACSFPAPGKGTPGYEDFAVMATALGGSMSSPLFQEVRERRGLAYSVGSWYDGQHDFGQVYVHAGTSSADALELLETIIDVITRAEHLLDEACVARARRSVRVSLAKARENPFGIARLAASSLLREGVIHDLSELEARVAAVDLDRVRLAARSLLSNPGACLGMVGPMSNTAALRGAAKSMFEVDSSPT